MTAFTSVRRTALGALTIIAGALLVMPAQAQNYPISSGQRATAQQVSERGVPLEELAPNAPDTYTVKRGDTLWGISGMYLKRPWRWPELWGMNLKAIPNPHLIFPGQTLYLIKEGGYARLSTSRSNEPETVRISPRTRSDSLADSALPTLKLHLIEPFLVEPLVVDEQVLLSAPRVIATTEERVLMAAGDRVYVRGDAASPMLAEAGEPRYYRVFRNAVALKDPVTAEVLGYEAQYLGKAELVRGESFEEIPNGKGGYTAEYIPATVDLSATYLDWARRNLELNGIHGPRHELIRADCRQWLNRTRDRYDLIFLDPPTFSNSKRLEDTFDIQRDHVELLRRTLRLLALGGVLIFSTNHRKFRLDWDVLADLRIEDWSRRTLPPDFARNPRIHQCWRITQV